MDIDDFIENLTPPCDIDHSEVMDFLDDIGITDIRDVVEYLFNN